VLTLATKIGVLGLTVLLFSMPTLACLAPTATLTEAERECCHQMADQCGNSDMPSSHSCGQQLADSSAFNFVLPVPQPVSITVSLKPRE
jgi:hypothetical protein